ncbi:MULTISPECIES: G5 domain-containing protein [Streptococcus]|nr:MULTISPECIES: G5 domain-containing protein [unclassified Streptococcus]QTH48582.1 G5 domain-containing protein [Streptococcus sp. zg-86]
MKEKSGFQWNKLQKYAIRKLAVGTLSVGIGTSFALIALPHTVQVAAEEKTRQDKVADIFKFSSLLEEISTFAKNPTPSYSDAEKQIDDVNASITKWSSKEASHYSAESWKNYQDEVKQASVAIAESTKFLDNLRQASTSQALEDALSEINAIRHRKDRPDGKSGWSYLGEDPKTTATDEEVNTAWLKGSELLSPYLHLKGDYLAQFGKAPVDSRLEKIRKDLEKSESNLEPTVAYDLESIQSVFDDPYELVVVDDINQLSVKDKEAIKTLIIDEILINYGATISFNGDNVIISYTDDSSESHFPLTKFAKQNPNKKPSAPITPKTEKKTRTETEEIDFDIEKLSDPNLEEGKTRTEEGVKGSKEVIYEDTLVDGAVTSTKKISETITKQPVSKKVYTGTKVKPVEPKIETKRRPVIEEIDFKTESLLDPNLEEGKTRTEEGVKGSKEVIYEDTLVDGAVTSTKKISEMITKQPVSKKVYTGTKVKLVEPKIETKRRPVIEDIDFKTESLLDPNLEEGKTRTEEGVEGSKEVIYEDTLVDGAVTSTKQISETITKQPISKKVYTGTKKTDLVKPVEPTRHFEVLNENLIKEDKPIALLENKDRIEERVVQFSTIPQPTDRLFVGEEELQPGKEGHETITYEDIYLNGQVVTSKEIKRTSIPAVNAIRYIGTKIKSTESDQSNNATGPTQPVAPEQPINQGVGKFEVPIAYPTVEEKPRADIKREQAQQEEIIPFDTIWRDDSTLLKGETRVYQEGQNGQIVRTVENILIDGVLAQTTVISEETVLKAIPRIILFGTKEIEPTNSYQTGGQEANKQTPPTVTIETPQKLESSKEDTKAGDSKVVSADEKTVELKQATIKPTESKEKTATLPKTGGDETPFLASAAVASLLMAGMVMKKKRGQ